MVRRKVNWNTFLRNGLMSKELEKCDVFVLPLRLKCAPAKEVL